MARHNTQNGQKCCDHHFPIQKYGSQRQQLPLFHDNDNYPNCAPQDERSQFRGGGGGLRRGFSLQSDGANNSGEAAGEESPNKRTSMYAPLGGFGMTPWFVVVFHWGGGGARLRTKGSPRHPRPHGTPSPVLHSSHQMWWWAPSALRELGNGRLWSIASATVGGTARDSRSTCEQRDYGHTLVHQKKTISPVAWDEQCTQRHTDSALMATCPPNCSFFLGGGPPPPPQVVLSF